jgi:hypothetical protein
MMPYDQMAAKQPVTEQDLLVWNEIADANAPHIRPGNINWVMIVRSLVAEVRRLQPQREAALDEAAEPRWIGRNYPGEGYATITCGKVSARIGYTALHNLGIRIDSDAAYWTDARDFMALLEECRRECAQGNIACSSL